MCLGLWILSALAVTAAAAGPDPAKAKADAMDYGPFLSYTVMTPSAPADSKGHHKSPQQVLAAKSINVRLPHSAVICFDTERLRYAAGWSGGFLDLSVTNLGGLKGNFEAPIQGNICFETGIEQGWTTGKFADALPAKQGPLSPDRGHYRGLYRCRDQIVFSYSVANAGVLDLPGSVASGDRLGFTRTLQIEKSAVPLTMLVCASDSPAGSAAMTAAFVGPAPREGQIQSLGGNIVLTVLPHPQPVQFKLLLCRGNPDQALIAAATPMEDLPALCKGGPALWKSEIEMQGKRSPDNGPYVLDTIELPDANPWHSWMRPSAFDFFPDGRAAICTLNGDVWIVSNLDGDLQHVQWKRIAAGLYEPLGLKIVEEQIYVLGKDQITRLHDLNGDGEADFYENFNSDVPAAPSYHAFVFDLQTDSHGDFYYAVCGNLVEPGVPMHGCIVKVSKDGSHSEVWAKGLRAPNGTGMGPRDELTCSDNQGHWTPACRINLVRQGGFYGFRGDPRTFKKGDAERLGLPDHYDPPLCWIPMPVDNSSGGEVWVSSDKWGPLAGQMLHTSYGMCALYEVLWEQVDGIPQGGVVKFPLSFASGVMRARCNPVDGQLYVCGLKGWQTRAGRDGCFQRVRYTGKPVRMPLALHVQADGIAITFSDKLDKASAEDGESYGIEQWNYHWTSTYGSPDFKLSDPAATGHDTVAVKSAALSADGRTVFLTIPDLKPVMQMTIQMHLNASDGSPIDCEIDNTINRIPPVP